MKKPTKEANRGKAKTKSVLDELIQQDARQIIQQAVEAKLAATLKQYSNVKSIGRGLYRIRLFRHDFAIKRQVARALPDGLRGWT
ncbi:MAG: hypothetical protein VB142_05040 [Burkholderia sp.]